MGQQGRQILPETIGEEQRGTVRRQDLHDVVDKALRCRQGAIAEVHREEQWLSGNFRGSQLPDFLGK